ncbi:hypothetical protein M0R45_000559 [Rubus argutus]|uniref:Protein kinase domain-containing protein n=1 Tax=Rubus argutus TaxID=59490 RepID=A0AAW1VKD1_RUBAR
MHSPPSVSHMHPPSLMLTLIIVVSALLVVGLIIFLLKRKQEVSGVVSNSQLSVDTSSISIEMVKHATENFLGKWGFSSVYKEVKEDENVVAVTKMDMNKYDEVNVNALKTFNSEVGVLNKVSHTNLVALIEYCQDEENLIVLYDYMAQGTLERHLFDWKN